MIFFVFLGFIAVKIYDKLGMRAGVLIGSVLTTCGVALQAYLVQSLPVAVIGFLLTSIAWPFLWNAHALVTSNLFPER